MSIAGQKADRNLDSSEKFVLGGAYGVRAYPQGEGAGDEGYLANVGLAHTVLPGVDASVFVDQGHVRTSHRPYASAPAAPANGHTLRGCGVAAALSAGNRGEFTLTTSLAWRDGDRAVTAPDKSPWLWVQAGWRF